MPGGSPGIPGWFIALFVIIAVVSVVIGIWRYSVLRSGGLIPFVAREQLEARLNQTLTAPPPGPDTSCDVCDRRPPLVASGASAGRPLSSPEKRSGHVRERQAEHCLLPRNLG